MESPERSGFRVRQKVLVNWRKKNARRIGGDIKNGRNENATSHAPLPPTEGQNVLQVSYGNTYKCIVMRSRMTNVREISYKKKWW